MISRTYATKSKNGKFYVNLNVVDLKEANQWGKNVSVEVEHWKPKETTGSTTEKYQKPNTPENFVDDSASDP